VTEHAVAVNAAALRNLAARLESWGLGDAYNRAEFIAMNLLADGYREIEKPPPIRPATIADPDSPGRRAFRNAVAEIANRTKEKP
jgi:hypothetical protein